MVITRFYRLFIVFSKPLGFNGFARHKPHANPAAIQYASLMRFAHQQNLGRMHYGNDVAPVRELDRTLPRLRQSKRRAIGGRQDRKLLLLRPEQREKP